jgi:hypothetical protein
VWLHQFQRRPGEPPPDVVPLPALQRLQPPLPQAPGHPQLQPPAADPGQPVAAPAPGGRQQRRVLNPRVVQVRRSGSPDSSGEWVSEGSDQAAAVDGPGGVGGVAAEVEGATSDAHQAAGGAHGSNSSNKAPPTNAGVGNPPASPAPATVAADVAAAAAAAPPPSEYVAPTPDQVCHPGDPWGVGQRWIEPWDEASAQQAVAALLAHWHG